VAHAFVLRRRVQFYETDAAGIVHFSTFFRYFEEAEHALWRENGLSIFPPHPTHGWPRVAATFDYRRPLRFEDEFEVHIAVTQLSGRSLTYGCRMICRGEVVAEGSMTIACVQRDADHTMRAVAIPEAIAARFRPASAEGSGAAGPPSAPPAAGSGAASPE
jgi:acyl-CoA thioester hydrolase